MLCSSRLGQQRCHINSCARLLWRLKFEKQTAFRDAFPGHWGEFSMEERFFLCLVPQGRTQCEGQALPSPRFRTQHMEMRVVSHDPDVQAGPSGLQFLCMESGGLTFVPQLLFWELDLHSTPGGRCARLHREMGKLRSRVPQRMDDHRQPEKTTFPTVLRGTRSCPSTQQRVCSGAFGTPGLPEREAVWIPARMEGRWSLGWGQTRFRRRSFRQWSGEKEAGVHAELKDMSLTAFLHIPYLSTCPSVCLSVYHVSSINPSTICLLTYLS